MRPLYLLFICLYISFSSLAQNSQGTDFWLAYMENLTLEFNDAPRFAIQVEASQLTEGSIVVPATGLTIPFTAPANEVTEVFLPDAAWYTLGSELVDNKGIRIIADQDIRVSAMHYRAYFSESTQVLPTAALGTEYLLTCYKDDNGNDPSSLVIVSTQEGTTVEITPSTLTLGLRPAGVPFPIELDEGQTYQVQAIGDLTGTRVRSLNGSPLAVFSGARQADVQVCTGGADSHLFEQAFPVASWSTTYHAVPFRNQGNDVIKVLAQQDNTTVYFDCTAVATLDAGEAFQTQLSSAVVITSTHAVAVSQFSTGGSCSNPGAIGDPNMMRLLPAGYQVAAVRFLSSGLFNDLIGNDYFTEHSVNIILPTSGVGGLSLDGNLVDAASFQPFPGNTAYSYAQLGLAEGVHFISSTTPFQAYSYGFGQFDAYTTRLGYSESVEVPFACLEIEVEGTFCVDSLLQFSFESSLPIVSQDWDFGGQGTSSETMPSFTFTQPGIYEVVLDAVSEDGSIYSDTLEIEILECEADICDTPQELILITEEEVCINTPFELAFEFTGSVLAAEWIFESGLSLEGLNPTTQISSPGSYAFELVLTDIYNCTYTAAGTLELVDCGPCPPPLVDPQFEGLPCKDSTITFLLPFDPIANPPLIIEWNINGVLYQEPNPTVTFTEAGPVSITFFAIDLQDCLFEGALDLEIIDCEENPCVGLPPISIDFEETLCVDSIATFQVITEASLESYNWESSDGSFGAESSFNTSFSDEGIFTVSLVALDEQGCQYSSAIDIEVILCESPGCQESVQIETDSTQVCRDSIVQFSSTGVAAPIEYNWLFNNESTSSLPMPELSFSEGEASVALSVITADGCTYSDSLLLEVVSCEPEQVCNYNYPNVFSPNGDGANDTFRLLFNCPPESYRLLVFNRWGGLVFETTDYQEGWDGRLRGQPASTDTYAYLAILEGADGEERQFQGTVSLIR
jgi:gliding motility-associated-like protein